MKNILNILSQNHNYKQSEIIEWQKIIQELLEIQPHEVKNIYALKQSTKIAFLFFNKRKYFFSIEELKKLLRLNERWIRLSEQAQDYKLNSHFYWHAWYVAKQLFKKTLQIEYSIKSLKYSKQALEKYNNNIKYQIQINNNIINLWEYIILKSKNNKLSKKWLKITLKKVEEQLNINLNYPNYINNISLNNLNNTKIKLQDMLKNI